MAFVDVEVLNGLFRARVTIVHVTSQTRKSSYDITNILTHYRAHYVTEVCDDESLLSVRRRDRDACLLQLEVQIFFFLPMRKN